MKPLSPSRQACMALTSSKETCQSILAVSTYDARYNHKPLSHVSYIRLRVTPNNDPSLLNPNRRLKSVNQLDIILACSNPALDSSHERAALHITLPALFLDVVLEPPRRTTAAAGGRTLLDVSISKSHSQCKVSILPQYQIVFLIPAAETRLNRCGMVGYRDCAGRLSEPLIVPPCRASRQRLARAMREESANERRGTCLIVIPPEIHEHKVLAGHLALEQPGQQFLSRQACRGRLRGREGDVPGKLVGYGAGEIGVGHDFPGRHFLADQRRRVMARGRQ